MDDIDGPCPLLRQSNGSFCYTTLDLAMELDTKEYVSQMDIGDLTNKPFGKAVPMSVARS